MRLDQALVFHKLTESRNEAQALIEKGLVIVDGHIVSKCSKNISENSTIVVSARRRFVSRGGEKLEGILEDIFGSSENIESYVKGKHALDVGSSTGGFTDCLLNYGAKEVVAVDVGTSQLHPKLRADNRVRSYENTDIRTFTATSFDIIVADLSFVSLEKIIPDLKRFSKAESIYFILIKPQFEVGKGGTKKGIVKDTDIIPKILSKYEIMAKELFPTRDIKLVPSKVIGGDGNQEYFLVIH